MLWYCRCDLQIDSLPLKALRGFFLRQHLVIKRFKLVDEIQKTNWQEILRIWHGQ